MKRFLKIVAAATIPVYIFIFLVFIFPRPQANGESRNEAAEIVQLWHVDMFEGGSGSRGEFLKQRAIEYEKKNPNKFILVKVLTFEQMINNLTEGKTPDIFSYGAGLSCNILSEICAFTGNIAVYENLLDSGVLENKVFAVPWCSGAYMLATFSQEINKEEKYIDRLTTSAMLQGKKQLYSFVAGYSKFNNPLLCAYLNNNKLRLAENSYDVKAKYSQADAYSRFSGKGHSVFLLGTQRDVVRIGGKENAADFSMQALSGYTDLVCYVSVCKNSAGIPLCTGFIEYLLNDEIQKKLTDINMFSVNTSGLYKEGIMEEMERGIKDSLVLNAFLSLPVIEENRQTVTGALNGDESSIKKISDMFSQ